MGQAQSRVGDDEEHPAKRIDDGVRVRPAAYPSLRHISVALLV